MHNHGLNTGLERKNIILPLVHSNKQFNLHPFVTEWVLPEPDNHVQEF